MPYLPIPPAKLVLVERRIEQQRVARALGFSTTYVNHALNGRIKPSPRFRAALAAFLDMPEGRLFHEDAGR